MSTVTVVVLVVVAVLTVLALGATVLVLVGHLRRLITSLEQLRDDLNPALDRLTRDAEMTRRELAEVSRRADAVRRDGR